MQETDAVAAANLCRKQTQWLQQTVQETDTVAAATLHQNVQQLRWADLMRRPQHQIRLHSKQKVTTL